MGLKIDMEKAYERLEWNFLLNVLKCFGLPSMWIQWVIQCVTTPSFPILINDSPYGFFRPRRGIHHGDYLSPFLFVLATEVLARLINREACQHKIKGFKLALDLMHSSLICR